MIKLSKDFSSDDFFYSFVPLIVGIPIFMISALIGTKYPFFNQIGVFVFYLTYVIYFSIAFSRKRIVMQRYVLIGKGAKLFSLFMLILIHVIGITWFFLF